MTNMFVTLFAKKIKVFSIFDSFVKKKKSMNLFVNCKLLNIKPLFISLCNEIAVRLERIFLL